MKNVKVKNMSNPFRSHRAVPNQYIITTWEGEFFQSYDSVIAFKPRLPEDGEHIVLDATYWDYSATTGKYRNVFLGEGIEQTREKIKSGEYVLADLNS